MATDKNKPDDPTVLTDVICPGDRLKPLGLWLPLSEQAADSGSAPETEGWGQRVPAELRPVAGSLVDEVAARVRGHVGRRQPQDRDEPS
ncbi:hypothetical protein J2T57_002133 [Natronocella acetinitrilica]|uniref:Uncharacterized protein n=1 Tax=Natronocella acetinitrilica TaxID=414046 RepID=A0AAE3G384_9GAMM|nr:hypothetical protein [Natronocella acetinitrilica]MCP1674995.1 hypothetical protein [Natronocella acetinitrilica]